MKENKQTQIFDDVFRTMEEHIPELMIPLINEVFKTNYSETIAITRLGDKRHILQNLVETDACLSIGGKLYHFECESNPGNGVIAIRMFQYDVAVALENKKRENGRYTVEFPASCVIYLRHNKNTKNCEQVLVRMPDGRELEYTVPVVKSQEYTKEAIFEKKLYVLLPYYILRYEKQLTLIEQEEKRRQHLLEEYEDICQRLSATLGSENQLGYSELHKLMGRVLDYILQERVETKKGVQQVMGGHVLESWKEEMIRIGRAEGLAKGRAEGHAEGRAEGHAEGQKNLLSQQIAKKIAKGKSVEQITEELEEDLDVIRPIYETLIKSKK